MTAKATLSVRLLAAKHGMKLWRKHRLRGALVEAHAALGERMGVTGIGDGENGVKISALNEKLRRADVVGGSAQALKTARRQLLLRLAATALMNDGPLPGADAEYRKAREAQAALNMATEYVT
jgi:hypothetical protein